MQPAASPQRRLGLRLAAGALLMLMAAAAFGLIAGEVVRDTRLARLDAEVARWLHAHATPPLTTLLLVVTQLHSTVAISVYAAVASLVLYARRRFRALATIVVCIAGGLALNAGVKLVFRRARPVFDDPLLTLATYSFPSGHTLASTLGYGLLVAWVWSGTRRPAPRVVVVGVAVAGIATVALSRIYLGVHYLSDVAGGFVEGLAWLALCLTAFAAFWREAPRAAAAAPATPALSASGPPRADR